MMKSSPSSRRGAADPTRLLAKCPPQIQIYLRGGGNMYETVSSGQIWQGENRIKIRQKWGGGELGHFPDRGVETSYGLALWARVRWKKKQ